jgi:hypothetical protein
MKKLIGLFIIFFVANTHQVFAQGTDCTVGNQRPDGGYIFYCDPVRYTKDVKDTPKKLPDGKIGLEAAPYDQSTWYAWSVLRDPIKLTNAAIGTGQQNTIDINKLLKYTPSAALLCAQQTIGGYNDWFLPSIEELTLMYTNLYLQHNKGHFTDYYYWSSSERENGVSVWTKDFWRGGVPCDFNKYVPNYVRCARAF